MFKNPQVNLLAIVLVTTPVIAQPSQSISPLQVVTLKGEHAAGIVASFGALNGNAAPFEPNQQEIQSMGQNLRKFLRVRAPGIAKKFDRYFFQLAGRTIGGKRFIFLHVIDQSMIKNYPWKDKLIYVDDGGDLCWHVRYEVDSGEFSEFLVNGVA